MIDLVLLVWLAALGGCVGSFLNVVVYRLPVGISIAHPGSHCPRCGRPIRWFDNVPVFSWLILRGRCRDCRAPIAVRYPLVEATVAGLFVLLGAVEALGGGVNLPRGYAPAAEGQLLWGIYGFHLLLLVTLLAAALIEGDRNPAPRRLVLPALFVALTAPFVWPRLMPVPLAPDVIPGLEPAAWLMASLAAPAGMAAGALAGLAAWPATGSGPAGHGGRGAALRAAMLVGGVLGWQAAVVLAAATSVGFLATTCAARFVPLLGRLPWTGILFVLAAAWICLWRPIVERWPALGIEAGGLTLLAALGLTVLASVPVSRKTFSPSKTDSA